MILSDGEIRAAIEGGGIVFDPELPADYLDVALTTSALDLRLGDELQFYRDLTEVVPVGLADAAVIDPSKQGALPDLVKKWGTTRSIAGSHYDLPPHTFVLGATLERVHLPESSCIAARVEGKSKMARLGFVVHMTAPTIHCGFLGNIVLEINNFGPYPIRLTPGMAVCQLVFERVGQPPLTTQTTQFQGQSGAAG